MLRIIVEEIPETGVEGAKVLGVFNVRPIGGGPELKDYRISLFEPECAADKLTSEVLRNTHKATFNVSEHQEATGWRSLVWKIMNALNTIDFWAENNGHEDPRG